MTPPFSAPAYAMTSPFDRPRSAHPQSGSVRVDEPRGDAPDSADAALAFLEGVRRGWEPSHIAAWIRSRLVRVGYLRPWDPASGQVAVGEERTRAQVPTSATDVLGDDAARELEAIAITARRTVLATLSGLIASPVDDRFLSAVIYTGRVTRVRTSEGQAAWEPSLREGENLSQWLLALLAADILTRRDTYDRTMCLCEKCGAVELREGGSRRLCSEHADVAPPGESRRAITRRPQRVR